MDRKQCAHFYTGNSFEQCYPGFKKLLKIMIMQQFNNNSPGKLQNEQYNFKFNRVMSILI